MWRKFKTSLFCWKYTHATLFVIGILTFGFLDAFTAVLMVEKYGIAAEFNPLIRTSILTQGIIGFIVFKVTVAALILSAPLFLQDMNWMTAGFLSVFSVNGALAAMNNYIFLMSRQVWVDPVIMVVAVLIMVVVMLQIGKIMDSAQKKKKMFKISDEMWERMKLEMGYPALATTMKTR